MSLVFHPLTVFVLLHSSQRCHQGHELHARCGEANGVSLGNRQPQVSFWTQSPAGESIGVLLSSWWELMSSWWVLRSSWWELISSGVYVVFYCSNLDSQSWRTSSTSIVTCPTSVVSIAEPSSVRCAPPPYASSSQRLGGSSVRYTHLMEHLVVSLTTLLLCARWVEGCGRGCGGLVETL